MIMISKKMFLKCDLGFFFYFFLNTEEWYLSELSEKYILELESIQTKNYKSLKYTVVFDKLDSWKNLNLISMLYQWHFISNDKYEIF